MRITETQKRILKSAYSHEDKATLVPNRNTKYSLIEKGLVTEGSGYGYAYGAGVVILTPKGLNLCERKAFLGRLNMKRQEILDKVVSHARRQKIRAVSEENINYCRYRMDDGRKCFIGCLIPDNLYTEAFEEYTIFDHKLEPIQKFLGADSLEDVLFLQELQSIHDDVKGNPAKWEAAFKMIAEENNLIYSEPRT
jgi:hypothetical protein